MLKHRLVKHPNGEAMEMMVLELEGDGKGPWFTARFPDMNTGRVHRAEVDILESKSPARAAGQYL